jgi:hypothetical protein
MNAEHFPNPLAARRTRRQLLRAALAGAALTVPLVRGAAPARAAGPHDCQKGCLWTADRRFRDRFDYCYGQGVLANTFFVFLPVLSAARLQLALLCMDRAVLQHKASSFDCSQPNCPGFDPTAAGGPCEDCKKSGGICCPDPTQQQGYACCTQPGGCCKGDGCHSGETDCGGGG